ncbi:MAG TPA: ketopantoate reductase family protein [Chloroflexota bacterium]|nr:ketopantoate reductase family protein [Chloroflexota bacterium]
MRYVIYGAGGVGSLFGGRLYQAGEAVVLIGRPAHVAQIKARGLRIVETDHTETIVSVAAAIEPLPQMDDVLILTVKSHDTPEALAELRRRYSSDTPIVCLQNGVRNEELANAYFTRVYGGLNVIGAQYLEPGTVEALGPRSLAIGVYPEGTDDLAQSVTEAARRAGFQASVHPRIMAPKWTKLVGNCHNAIFALCNLPVHEAFADPAACQLIQMLRDEASTTLTAAGIAHDPIPPVGPAASSPPPPVPMYGSTWMDFRLGRGKNEVDFFNGEIVRVGEQQGIPTPANRLIAALSRVAAERGDPPGGYTPAQLLEMVRTTMRAPPTIRS